MLQCLNCRRTYGCSCQSRRASDGTPCCSVCIQQVEQQIQIKKQQITQPPQTPHP